MWHGRFNQNCIISSGVGRKQGERSHHRETEKNCCRNLVLSSRAAAYFRSRGQKSLKNFEKNYEKGLFSIEILINISHNFLKIFQKFGLFWAKRTKLCMSLSFFALFDGNHSSYPDYLVFFKKIQSIFSKNFKKFHFFTNIPRSKRFSFAFLDKIHN